ncbi:MAG: hypothetical protein JRD94_17025 [Deltaproteobacteria bacterium]|nr:hypothetical protein [Deltaproteobacteria bacterium]
MSTQTIDTLSIPKKSTNVRSHISGPAWLRATFSAAGYVAPSLTAGVAERLFFKTRRNGPRPGERDVLEEATPSTIAGMKGTQLGSFVEPLVARGYRVVAFDAFGHGESPGNSMSIPELASCIRQVSDELGGVYVASTEWSRTRWEAQQRRSPSPMACSSSAPCSSRPPPTLGSFYRFSATRWEFPLRYAHT